MRTLPMPRTTRRTTSVPYACPQPASRAGLHGGGFRPTGSLAALMDPVVRFRSAVSLLGRFPALAGVDLEVARGETVLVQGPNGAGKTTLLRACAGLVGLAGGEIEVLGCDLRRNRRAVTMAGGRIQPAAVREAAVVA